MEADSEEIVSALRFSLNAVLSLLEKGINVLCFLSIALVALFLIKNPNLESTLFILIGAGVTTFLLSLSFSPRVAFLLLKKHMKGFTGGSFRTTVCDYKEQLGILLSESEGLFRQPCFQARHRRMWDSLSTEDKLAIGGKDLPWNQMVSSVTGKEWNHIVEKLEERDCEKKP